MPHRQVKQGEPLTFGDRLVTAFLGGLCGFGTMLLVWLIVMYAGGRMRDGNLVLPFYWTWIVAGTAAALAFLAGPERTMDAFERVWRVVGTILFWTAPGSDRPTRRSKRR